MAKTELTKKLEIEIWKATCNQGTFGCFEVTIGWFGSERVDYMTYNTKGQFRCYEIKVSAADFHSTAHNTFLGHYNYYVMPVELYEQIKHEVPENIGVYTYNGRTIKSSKKAKKSDLKEDVQVLKDSMIRSLCREADKQYENQDENLVASLRRGKKNLERERNDYRNRYWELLREVQELYGTRWNKKDDNEIMIT